MLHDGRVGSLCPPARLYNRRRGHSNSTRARMSGALTLGNANTLRAYLHVSAGKRGSKCECFPLSSSCTGYVEMSALGNNRAKLIEAPFVTDVADIPRHPGHAGCPTTMRPGDRCPRPAKREIPPGSIRRMRLTQQYPDLPVGSWQLN
jgi:hypothetical protein